MQRSFSAPRLGLDKRGVKRNSNSCGDFILHFEQIGERLVEPICPEMCACFCVHKLNVDANSIFTSPHRTLEHVTHVQIATDLLEIDGLAFVSECRVSANN